MVVGGFTPWSALIGGALIGLGALLLMLSMERIAGISGIAGGVFRPQRGWVWVGGSVPRPGHCPGGAGLWQSAVFIAATVAGAVLFRRFERPAGQALARGFGHDAGAVFHGRVGHVHLAAFNGGEGWSPW